MIPALDLLTQNPDYLAAALGTAVVLLFLFFLNLYREEQKLADYNREISLADKSPRWIEKKAQELTRVEAYRLAGDLRAHLGQNAEAAALYQKGGNPIRAAECFLAAGKKTEAAEACLERQDYKRAAALFLEAGNYKRAGETHLAAGNPLAAAQTYERGGALESAAEIYLLQGLYRRAANLYAKEEKWSRAAEALWRSYGEERARLPEEVSAADSMPLRLLSREAGELFRQAGRFEEAGQAFCAGGWLLENAKTLEQSGRMSQAAEAYLNVGDLLKAAEGYEKAGDGKKAARLQARYYTEAGQEREAVPFLEAAGEFAEAAAIHRRFEDWLPAADRYERAGDFASAAGMYEKAQDFGRAARAREKSGEFRAAADLYGRAGDLSAQAELLEKAGDFFAAGENYFGRKLLDRAITALQKVEPSSPESKPASFLLGRVFREKGMLELAYEYFHHAVKDEEVSRGNLEYYYQLAVNAERIGRSEEAGMIYERILVLDFHFQDAADRLKTIKSQKTQVAVTSGVEYEITVSRPAGEKLVHPAAVISSERYTLVSELGRGGMGIVYRARDNILERVVAYKVLPANLKEHPQALKNFFREAKSAARLNHPNIVTVYDAGEESGNYYIAMELIEGESVKQILNREHQLPLKASLMIGGQVCKALEYAHERRIVHRDVKSSNIMWTPDKQVKLMDFGLAKVIEEVKGYQTIASGTPYYMSPEQTLGRNIDHRTDIYSLGITLFEMVTGVLPFLHGDAAYHHVHTPPPEARSLNPDLPPALNLIILKCMQKKPEDRYQNARDLFNALREAAAG